jgi:hypothetical protein
MKAYRVIKSSDDYRIWYNELEKFIGEILKPSDLDWNPYICESENWMIINIDGVNKDYAKVLPTLIHRSCLEEISLCECPKYQVFNTGCTCGGY